MVASASFRFFQKFPVVTLSGEDTVKKSSQEAKSITQQILAKYISFFILFRIISFYKILECELCSYRVRTCKRDLKKIHQIITLLIWLLLFILGIEVGSNEQIIKGLHTIGLEAVILTLGGTLGSVIAAWALWRALYNKKGGRV